MRLMLCPSSAPGSRIAGSAVAGGPSNSRTSTCARRIAKQVGVMVDATDAHLFVSEKRPSSSDRAELDSVEVARQCASARYPPSR